MELASTGIQGLDGHLGGGVPRGTTILVMSEPDNALPTFAEQFAGGGVNQGEQIVYFELDRPADSLRQSIATYAVNATAARKATLKVYDGYASSFGRARTPDKAVGFASPLGRGELFPTMLREAQAASQGAYRMIVESLSSVVTPNSEEETLEFVRTLAYLGHEQGGVHFLGLVKGLHSPVFETRLRHMVGGVFELGMERKSFGLYPYLFVAKLIGAKDPIRMFPLKETERGLTLETAKRL